MKLEFVLLDRAAMQRKLAEFFGPLVDWVNRRAIERSRNRFRKQFILFAALPIDGDG
jgi:predicted nucleotidyltransferase